MLVPVFTLKLNHKIIPRLVSIGKYDGKHPCLTAATTGNKIFLHNPHHQSQLPTGGRLEAKGTTGDISLLNMDQQISSVVVGTLESDVQTSRDMLFVGTQTNLLAYDVDNNSDLFYKDIPDGVNSLLVGKVGNSPNPLVFAGGNCSIQGFDNEGNDDFWTVTGDNVSSLALCDFNDDGENELIVGSEDFDIRVFKDDEIISEMTETEAITALCPLYGSRFGYALANGTVGVYDKTARYWRIKSKNQVISIHNFDLDGDGVPELITGWSNGKVDARSDRTGEVVFKDNLNGAIAGIVNADYRMDGHQQLIVSSVDGEVRGFVPPPPDRGNQPSVELTAKQDTLREMSQKKQNLLLEIKNYVENTKFGSSSKDATPASDMGVIPANTQLQTSLLVIGATATQPACVELTVKVTNNTIVRTVMIFAEGIFEGESYVVHPQSAELTNVIKVPIFPPRDVPVDLHIKAFVGSKNSEHFHVFELTRQLPRFALYELNESAATPNSYVQFEIKERINRVLLWINQNFLLNNELTSKETDMNVKFMSQRTNLPLQISMTAQGMVTISTDDMDVAGDIVQSLVPFLGIENMQSRAEFSGHMEELKGLLMKADELHTVRERLTAEMADHSNLIRSLVVRAEDSRLMSDMKNMRRGYMELYDLNRDLINGYRIRCTNHDELLKCLKIVNQIIQRAGKLRVGEPKRQVVAACRNAIKNNDIGELVKIIRFGSSV